MFKEFKIKRNLKKKFKLKFFYNDNKKEYNIYILDKYINKIYKIDNDEEIKVFFEDILMDNLNEFDFKVSIYKKIKNQLAVFPMSNSSLFQKVEKAKFSVTIRYKNEVERIFFDYSDFDDYEKFIKLCFDVVEISRYMKEEVDKFIKKNRIEFVE